MQALFDLQLSSIKHYAIASFVPDVKVHYIVQRYAQLTASLLSLNADYQVYPTSFSSRAAYNGLTVVSAHHDCRVLYGAAAVQGKAAPDCEAFDWV